MPLRRVVPAVVAVALLTAAPAATAHPTQRPRDGGTVAPVERIGGLSAGQIMALSFARSYQQPAPSTFGCVALVRGAVELVVSPEGGAPHCTIQEGTKILLIGGATCSTAEQPPFYGRDEREQRACARAAIAQHPTLAAAIDGGPPVDITADRFGVGSPQFRVDVRPGNESDATPGPATVVAEGWIAAFTLSPGHHTIALTPAGENAAPPVSVTVDVVPRCAR
jgi:hypothetical protein